MVKKRLSSLFKSQASLRSHAGTDSSSNTDDLGSRPSYSTSATSLDASSIKKRPRSPTEGGDELDEYDRRSHRSRSSFSSSLASGGKILACPYVKRYPQKYSALDSLEVEYRHCSTGSWSDISRLKQHLYRVHCRPEHNCPCCFEAFETADLLDEHSRQRTCLVKPSPFSEKMTNDQKGRLQKKNPRVDKSKCWYNIYAILFPGANMPQSPFAGESSSELLQIYHSFYRRKAPSRLAAIIESRLSIHSSAIVPQLHLPRDLLEDSISELFQQLGHEFLPDVNADPKFDGIDSSFGTLDRAGIAQRGSYIQFESLPLIPASRLISTASETSWYSSMSQPQATSAHPPANSAYHHLDQSNMPNDFDMALEQMEAPFPDRTRLSWHSGIPSIEMYLNNGYVSDMTNGLRYQ